MTDTRSSTPTTEIERMAATGELSEEELAKEQRKLTEAGRCSGFAERTAHHRYGALMAPIRDRQD
jgi:hypothetical protein